MPRRFALAADAHRKMPAAWKNPDVAFEARQKLDVDLLLRGRYVIAERAHGVLRAPFGADLTQRIARARRDDAEIRFGDSRLRAQAPSTVTPLDSQHPRFLDRRAGALRSLQQHPVQIDSRIDHQRMGQVHLRFTGLRRRDHGFPHQPFRRVVVDQKRIFVIRLVGKPAAAWLFPRELFIEDRDLHPGRGQTLRREGSGRAAAQNSDSLHCFEPTGGCPGGMPSPDGAGVPSPIDG